MSFFSWLFAGLVIIIIMLLGLGVVGFLVVVFYEFLHDVFGNPFDKNNRR